MNRLLAAFVAAAVIAVTGCAGQDPTRQTLNQHLDSIRDAAAAGDLDAAQHELDQLHELVRQAKTASSTSNALTPSWLQPPPSTRNCPP